MLERWWNSNGFKIMIYFSIVTLCIISLYNYLKKKNGTYSNTFYYKPKYMFQLEENGFISKLELECKYVLEHIFKKPFTKIRPDMLKNPVTGFNLELDCYNEELKLGVEIQGIQHYKYTPYFHKNIDKFTIQQYRDEIKRNLCKQHGIYLIEVPYNIKIKNVHSYLKNEIKKYNNYINNEYIKFYEKT